MDATPPGKAEELAKEIAVSISIRQELVDVMRLMTKSAFNKSPQEQAIFFAQPLQKLTDSDVAKRPKIVAKK